MSSTFAFNWSISWAEFEKLSAAKRLYSDKFITSKNGNAYEWCAFLNISSTLPNKFGVFLQFTGGTFSQVHGVACSAKVNSCCKPKYLCQTAPHNYVLGTQQGTLGWNEFGACSKAIMQKKYALSDAQPLILRFVLVIPNVDFKYTLPYPKVEIAPTWLLKQFENIHLPFSMEERVYSDIELESSDGVVFFAHKQILQCQSKPLATIIHRDVTDGRRRVSFPSLNQHALRALLEFLYTGSTRPQQLLTQTIISVMDAAEQYELPVLKNICAAALWSRAMEKITDVPDIITAANTYNFKELKMRAISILVDNYEMVNASHNLQQKLSEGLNREITSHAVYRSRCNCN